MTSNNDTRAGLATHPPGMDEEIRRLIWITEWRLDRGYTRFGDVWDALVMKGTLKIPVDKNDDEYTCRIKAMETFNLLLQILRSRNIKFAEYPELTFTGELSDTLGGEQRLLHQRANVSLVFRRG